MQIDVADGRKVELGETTRGFLDQPMRMLVGGEWVYRRARGLV